MAASPRKAPRWAIALKLPRRGGPQPAVHLVAPGAAATGVITPVAGIRAGWTWPAPALQPGHIAQRRSPGRNWISMTATRLWCARPREIIPEVVRVAEQLRAPGGQAPASCPPPARSAARPWCARRARPATRFREQQLPADPATGALRTVVSKAALDVDASAAKLIEQLVDQGLVTSIAASLPPRCRLLASLEKRMGETSALKRGEGMALALKPPSNSLWHRQLYCLGHPPRGAVNAKAPGAGAQFASAAGLGHRSRGCSNRSDHRRLSHRR